MASQEDIKTRQFLSVIGDRDSVNGLLLGGIGHVTGTGTEQVKNFLDVDDKTETSEIEEFFVKLTVKRDDIAVLLITQPIADRIRHLVAPYNQRFPAVLEIPSKDHPYDPEKDSFLNRVHQVAGK